LGTTRLGGAVEVTAAAVVRKTVLQDPLLRGDLGSEDGTVTAIVVTFDEDRIDDVRAGVIDRIHAIIDPKLPPATNTVDPSGATPSAWTVSAPAPGPS